MASASSAESKTRRRGEHLENALLEAAWLELKHSGFNDFTIDAVAQRAKTSRAVLYRRWPGKFELVAAAARFAVLRDRGPRPEPTGSLREDLLGMLRWANRTDVRTMIETTAHLGEYLSSEGLTFQDFREAFLRGRAKPSFSPIDAAVERGEIDPAVLTPRVRSLVFDLFRHEVLINARPVTEEAMAEIVDEVVIPLLTRKP